MAGDATAQAGGRHGQVAALRSGQRTRGSGALVSTPGAHDALARCGNCAQFPGGCAAFRRPRRPPGRRGAGCGPTRYCVRARSGPGRARPGPPITERGNPPDHPNRRVSPLHPFPLRKPLRPRDGGGPGPLPARPVPRPWGPRGDLLGYPGNDRAPRGDASGHPVARAGRPGRPRCGQRPSACCACRAGFGSDALPGDDPELVRAPTPAGPRPLRGDRRRSGHLQGRPGCRSPLSGPLACLLCSG